MCTPINKTARISEMLEKLMDASCFVKPSRS